MKALVLAGGIGSHLGDITKYTPKSLVDVAGRPVIDHVLWQLAQHGYTEIIMNVSYLYGQIIRYLGDRVVYFYEPMLLNTAGTVNNLADWFDRDILVVNGDTINNADYTKLAKEHKEGLMDVTVLSKNNKCAGAYMIYKTLAKENFEVGKRIDECIEGHVFYYNQPDIVYHDIGTPEKLTIARNYYGKKTR